MFLIGKIQYHKDAHHSTVSFKMYYDQSTNSSMIKVPTDHFSGITQANSKVHMIWLIILILHIFPLTLFLCLNHCAPRPRLRSSLLINTYGWTNKQEIAGWVDGWLFLRSLIPACSSLLGALDEPLKSRGSAEVVAVAIERAYAKWPSLFLLLSLQSSYVHCWYNDMGWN